MSKLKKNEKYCEYINIMKDIFINSVIKGLLSGNENMSWSTGSYIDEHFLLPKVECGRIIH